MCSRQLGLLEIGEQKFSMVAGHMYIVGARNETYKHDIEIDDEFVDIKHCLLDFTQNVPKLMDIRSKCGTFIEGARVDECKMTPLLESVSLQFGNKKATLRLFLQDQLGYTGVHNSDAMGNFAQHHNCSINHLVEDSISSSSTPAIKKYNKKVVLDDQRTTDGFDSFYVPETQCITPMGNTSHNLSVDVDESVSSTFTNRHQLRSVNSSTASSEFFVPETQCPVNKSNTSLETTPAATERNDDEVFIPETQEIGELPADNEFELDDLLLSSQFRISTQDFDGSLDDFSNTSDDILADIPTGTHIPLVDEAGKEQALCFEKEAALQKDGPLPSTNEPQCEINELEITIISDEDLKELELMTQHSLIEQQDKRLSTLQEDNAQPYTSVPPCDAKELETKIIIPQLESVTQHSFDDEQDDISTEKEETMGIQEKTQIFIKPLPRAACSTKNAPPCVDLAPTQVFIPRTNEKLTSPITSKPSTISSCDFKFASPKTYSSNKLNIKPVSRLTLPQQNNIDDLPPTQVFVPINAEESVQKRTSIRARVNKLLDSDDDEMDEIVAPELVEKMRESIRNLEKSDTKDSEPNSKNLEPAPAESNPEPVDPDPVSDMNSCTGNNGTDSPLIDVNTNPTSSSKRYSRKQPIVNVDDFLQTPDFLKTALPSDENLQKVAEQKWKKINAERRKPLYTETDEGASSGNETYDSFGQLLVPNEDSNSRSKRATPTASSPSKLKHDEEPLVKPRGRKRTSSKKESTETTPLSSKDAIKNKVQLRKPAETGKADKTKPKSDVSEKHRRKRTKSETQKPLSTTHDFAKNNVKLRAAVESDNKNESKSKLEETEKHQSGAKNPTTSRSSRHHSKEIEKKPPKDKTANQQPKPSDQKSESGKPVVKSKRNKDSDSGNGKDANKEKEKDRPKKDKSSAPKRSLAQVKEIEVVKSKKMKTESENPSKTKEKKTDDTPRLTRNNSRTRNTTTSSSNTKETNSGFSRSSSKGSIEEAPIKRDTADGARQTEDTKAAASSKNSKTKQHNLTVLKDDTKTKSTSQTSIELPDKPRKNSIPRGKIKIAITMCDLRYQTILEQHAGPLWLYTTDPKECDVLVMQNGNRTYKLMVAIARGIPVVKIDWLNEVLKTKRIDVPMEAYIFDDSQFQKRHQFVLKDSLEAGKKAQLFNGCTFLMTPSIKPVPSEMKDILSCSGGIVLDNVPKSHNGEKLFLISILGDKEHWHQHRRINSKIRIITTEGVMTSVMRQSLEPLLKSPVQ